MEKITKVIEVSPIHLHQGIKDCIKEILKSTRMCNSDGYIESIHEVEHIENVGISKHTSFPIFKVVFTATKILPEIGKNYTCKITQIYSYAVVMEYKGPVKIILPDNNLGDWKIEDMVLVDKKGKKYNKEDYIDVTFVNIKYSKGIFNCIAKISS